MTSRAASFCSVEMPRVRRHQSMAHGGERAAVPKQHQPVVQGGRPQPAVESGLQQRRRRYGIPKGGGAHGQRVPRSGGLRQQGASPTRMDAISSFESSRSECRYRNMRLSAGAGRCRGADEAWAPKDRAASRPERIRGLVCHVRETSTGVAALHYAVHARLHVRCWDSQLGRAARERFSMQCQLCVLACVLKPVQSGRT